MPCQYAQHGRIGELETDVEKLHGRKTEDEDGRSGQIVKGVGTLFHHVAHYHEGEHDSCTESGRSHAGEQHEEPYGQQLYNALDNALPQTTPQEEETAAH